MKKILSLVTLLCVALVLHGAVVNYTADNTTVFPNPERGYTVQNNKVVSTSDPRLLGGSPSFSGGELDNIRLRLLVYYLNNYRTADLPDAILNGFDEDMATLRANGWKCILRFAYCDTDSTDTTPQWVGKHLKQLQPHLAANADVIYVMEAGFIGKYGEWYYTLNYENKSQRMNASRRQVVDSIFKYAPTDRFILFRTPITKYEYYGDYDHMGDNTLTSAEAFTGTQKARWGHHNDAFLANWGNAGTYYSYTTEHGGVNDDPAVRSYVAAETNYVPNGGETNVTDADEAEAVYADAPSEMSTYHWSFCGNSYAEAVTSRWRTSGIYDTLNVHMGYRYNLITGTYSDVVEPGNNLSVSFSLKNTGYAPIYNERTAYIVLRNSDHSYSLPLSADPRLWAPGSTANISETLALPSEMSGGTYSLYLWLPDQYTKLHNDSRYSVRIANASWDSEAGMNYLGATVIVDAPITAGELEANTDSITAGSDKLSAAISAANTGDVIVLKAGTYTETATFTIDKNITIKAATGATAVIKPEKYMNIADGVTVKFIGVMFNATSFQSGDYHIIRSSGTTGNNCLILDSCEFYNYANNSALLSCRSDKKLDYMIVNNCKFYDINKSCIFLENTDTKYLRVSNSSFYNLTAGSGFSAGFIHAKSSTGIVIVDHCTFYNCESETLSYPAVFVRYSSNATVSNCVFKLVSTEDMCATYLQGGGDVKYTLTHYYDNWQPYGHYKSATVSNCLEADPVFANAASSDFTLGSTSPCLRAGSDGSHIGDPRWWPTSQNINITTPASGKMTYVTTHALDFSNISGLKAYIARQAYRGEVTMTAVGAVPAGTPLVLIGTGSTQFSVPVISEAAATAPTGNLLRAGDGYTTFSGSTYDYIIWTDGLFHQISGGSVPYGKAYLHLSGDPLYGTGSSTPGVRIIFEDNNATSFESVETKSEATKFIENGRLFIRKNGITYDALGRIIR